MNTSKIERRWIDRKQVMAAIKAGDVRMQKHPTLPLAILNYTQQCQFAGHWDDITTRCRGLVVEWKTRGEKLPIVIESPPKFFNHNEPQAPDLTKWNFYSIWISEKLDGYYISIRDDSQYGLIVTSRGSFDNQYVDAAKSLLPDKFAKDVSYFCELCMDFPGDESIIVMRHPIPTLVLWGVEGAGGHVMPAGLLPMLWSGEKARRVVDEAELKQYMAQDVEGVVAFHAVTCERVKFKTQWYLDTHRIINGCSKKKVWEILEGGGLITTDEPVTEFEDADGEERYIQTSMLPEELLIQMMDWQEETLEMKNGLTECVWNIYEMFKDKTAKDLGLEKNIENDLKAIVFPMLRNKSDPTIDSKKLWKAIRNRLERPPERV